MLQEIREKAWKIKTAQQEKDWQQNKQTNMCQEIREKAWKTNNTNKKRIATQTKN